MTQEEKQLLLKDLCARLPYDVKVAFQVGNNIPDIRIFTGKDYNYLKYYHFIDEFTRCTFKPYLRPMSSMTLDEIYEFRKFSSSVKDPDKLWESIPNYAAIDWLLAHHFDFRYLIEGGLALEAPEGMYKIE